MNTMNERLREFERESGLEIYGLGARRILWEAAMERFAQLIIKETLEVARAGVEYGDGMEDAVYKYFGVEKSKGWVCPKCGADRTKIACPLGFGAQVDGRCPMTAEAQ